MDILKFEHRSDPILPRPLFVARMLSHTGFAIAVLACSLGIGVCGYWGFEDLSWIDALLNASMILGGMGPVDVLHTTGGKIFASFYALFSGVVFLVVAGIIVAPFVHRLMHRMHLESEDQQ